MDSHGPTEDESLAKEDSGSSGDEDFYDMEYDAEKVSMSYFESKVVHQRRGLFIKNYLLQRKAKLSNCIQIVTPIVALALIGFVGLVGNDLFKTMINTKID